jgi:uncharacterized NAD-dependent epimerase/dehydratase family protein
MSDRLAIYAEGLFANAHGKTGHGIIRYGQREVVAVVDSTTAGQQADEVVPFTARSIPVVATLQEAIDLGATRLVIGVAPTGGRLPPAWTSRPACTTSSPPTPTSSPPRRRMAASCATCAASPPT